MTFHRILLALLVFFAPLAAPAQSPYTFTLRHKQLGTFYNYNWSISGHRAVRLQYLNLYYAPYPRKSSDYHLVGQVRFEDTGLWNFNAWRIGPGKYKVWFSRRGTANWSRFWTIPQMRLTPRGTLLSVTNLTLTKQFPLGRIDGSVRFNAAAGNLTLHGATLQPTR